ncbi:hypothetical protein [Marinobacter sp. Arc7-DN-1]|uniref:hypothetical protein n=1 Tax=Marinobacter sp. Arc7-DN-1 TaxID=2304594 RepID=UPI001D0D9806|nr:hypothetical protein [Marinobacter sp. Arc7-DN-1]
MSNALAAEEGWHYRYEHGSVDGEIQPALVIADHHGGCPDTGSRGVQRQRGRQHPAPGGVSFPI